MSFFRRKKDVASKTSSLSVYGQGRKHALQNAKNADRVSESNSFSSMDLEDRPHPLAFAEATYDSSLPIRSKSRLSKELNDVLSDNEALAYFIQFMDAHLAKHLVKFWLDAESFHLSSQASGDIQLSLPTRDGSGSSGYLSDKSDDVFPSSSQVRCGLDSMQHTGSSLNSVNRDLNAETHCTEISLQSKVPLDNTVSNSSHNRESQSTCDKLCDSKIKQNSSVDSGCEDKLGTEASFVVNTHEHKLFSNERVQKEDDSQVCDTNPSELYADGFVRLVTSREQDALAIYTKYISEDASSSIGISPEMRLKIKDCVLRSPGDMDSNCFVPAQEYVVRKMEKEYYPKFLRSSFHCKYQIDILTSGTVYLADILYNDSALFFFMEFMEQEGVRHLVDFLLMSDNFHKHLISHDNTYDGSQAQTDAMVLYDKYFSLQATAPLGFSDVVRFDVEANICQETGPNPDCFMLPVNILTQYLEKTFLLQFLHSQLYFKYISECIITIQNDGRDCPSSSKYTASDSGSEKSLPISSMNTLLAMDGKQPGTKVIRNLDDQDMRIDTRQFDPDALWQKKVARNLQMAHVDHLGRVTTEFEPDPEKQKESKISKAVKKLVKWEEDKNQEEMAWKVAEMIVKDICNVTMPPNSTA